MDRDDKEVIAGIRDELRRRELVLASHEDGLRYHRTMYMRLLDDAALERLRVRRLRVALFVARLIMACDVIYQKIIGWPSTANSRSATDL